MDGNGISIIVPLYNEGENVRRLVSAVEMALDVVEDWELITVDDGSSDDTLKRLHEEQSHRPYMKVVTYLRNKGQGNALKAGFKAAKGDVIVTLDADLSYDPKDIMRLVEPLQTDRLLDIVIGSPYSRGGRTEGVPFFRLFLSRGANYLLGFALPGHLRTVTGMFRAYRRSLIDCLDVQADGKEIHFEILSKALATGSKVIEVPAVLRGREAGKSKIHVRGAIVSHLLFSFFERPAILFEIIGSILLVLGLVSGVYIVWLWQHSELDPTRPLMLLMALLILVGSIVLSFGFIASQIAEVRKEVYRVQRENLDIKRHLENKQNGESS
jgi:glycosyltransferase involved in cell wall biosynthesis